ncbi:MAG: CRTAC1 family protein [Gemmatimonadetes bacterium]|nr:CRTAC1 family protein [Gemmatimonadota bacterium]
MPPRTTGRLRGIAAAGLAAMLVGCNGDGDRTPGSAGADAPATEPAAGADHHSDHHAAHPSGLGAHEHDHVMGHVDPDTVTPVDAKHAELLEIARSLAASDDPYFGRGAYEALLARDPETVPRSQRAQHAFELAKEHFKFGRPDEAERHFRTSYDLSGDVVALYLSAVAALRAGELANCLEGHNPESCVFPLRGGGIHADPAGAARAAPLFLEVLEQQPKGLKGAARFLLNLSAMAAGEWPDAVPERYRLDPELFGTEGGTARFEDLAPSRGITAMNHAGGAAMDDFDGDGRLDILTSTSSPARPLLFYRNRGNGQFEERGAAAGLEGQVGGLNLVHADYDNDGWLDVLVLRGGWLMERGCQPRSLLRNVGGRFEDVTEAAGLDEARYPSQTAAFADYDLDGDLDLFIGNEAVLREELAFESGGFDLPGEGDLPYPSQLLRNDGGRFTDVTAAAGVQNLRYAKGCAWGDFDGDRDPDLYVSNQWGANRLYRNDGGVFTDIAPELDVTEPVYSFPVWSWDYDNDGLLDLFVASYRGNPSHTVRSYLNPGAGLGENRLYRNTGVGTRGGGFRNLAPEAGLTTLTLTMGANFADLDADGWLDFYLATGTPRFDALVPNVFYRADGHGGFRDETGASGLGNLQKGHGVAFGDIDNDGDEDLFLQSGGFFEYDGYFNGLYRNPGNGSRWITVQLEGVDSNRFGFGARIRATVETPDGIRDIYRFVGPAGSFGSSSVQQEIGLGNAVRIQRLEVYWPVTDSTQSFEGVALDRSYRVREHAEAPEALDRPEVKWEGS